MGKKLLFILFLFAVHFSHSQNREHVSFSQAIEKNIKKYIQNSQKAYQCRNFERADFLFDSLVHHVVIGSYLDNFPLHRRSGKKIMLHKFKKPVVLISYSTWCTPGKGEIPALNEIARKYRNKLDFVVLFWDTKKNVRKSSGSYSKDVQIVYVDEKENTNDHLVRIMKHSFGFPTVFFIDADKRVVDIRRTTKHYYKEEYETSFDLNYSFFIDGVSSLNILDYDKENFSLPVKNTSIENTPSLEFQ